MKNFISVLLVILLMQPVIGQGVQMRTRLLTSLSNVEIEEYLKRNDVIFVPVGVVEVHGGLPLDCEYVGPLGLAMKMAEEADGLVLPNLVYFYPGATQVGRGTVQVSPSEGTDYLKIIARSLLRQGFKTQIYITGHGPAYSYMESFVFEFLDEEKVPILYMNQGSLTSKYGINEIADFNTILYGAYSIVGRLNDIPLSFEGIDLPEDFKPTGTPSAVSNLLGLNNVQSAQWYYDSQFDHFGVPESITATEREQLAKQGVEAIDKLIEAMDINSIVNDLKEHQKYIEETSKKYGDLLDFKY